MLAADVQYGPLLERGVEDIVGQLLEIHPDNPQQRLISQAVKVLHGGGVIAYPTDSCYALGCHIGDKAALERIASIRRFDKHHNFTLICRDLSEIASYARVDNSAYRLLKAHTPGAYTFILPATKDVPRRLQNPKRKTVGIRVPDHQITQALLAALGEPMMSVTLMLPNEDIPLNDPFEIETRLGDRLDLIIDGGYCGLEPTSVIDLMDGVPRVTRAGLGDVGAFV